MFILVRKRGRNFRTRPNQVLEGFGNGKTSNLDDSHLKIAFLAYLNVIKIEDNFSEKTLINVFISVAGRAKIPCH